MEYSSNGDFSEVHELREVADGDKKPSSETYGAHRSEGAAVKENNNVEAEVVLVEIAFLYLTEKRYPHQCMKNDKKSIRRKAERLAVRDGDLYYKQDGKEVRASYLILLRSTASLSNYNY